MKRFLFVCILIFLGCQNSSDKDGAQAFTFDDADQVQLIEDLNELQIAISLRQVLQKNPERHRNIIDTALSKARAGLLVLAKSGPKTEEDKKKAYYQFVDAIRQYDSFRILEFEQERFDRVFNQVRFLKFELAKELTITTQQQTWTIFNHNFSTSGLEPNFTTLGFSATGKPNDEARWFTNFQIDLPKARVQGRNGANGWLISRPFDLSQVDEPSFRYFGSYLVVAPNNVLPLSEVITSIFKTYILIDYKSGENPDAYPDNRKILVEYDVDSLPLGRDFHDAWVPFKSLEEHKFKGEISVAFLFDTRGVNFTQYYSWTMFDFELNGAGKIQENLVKYKHEFDGAGLGKYKSYSFEFPGGDWKVSDNKASISSGADKISTMLLSPKLDVPKEMQSPNLVIKESFLKEGFSIEDLDKYEILISKDFKGGQSPLESNWKKIDHKLVLEEPTEGESEAPYLNHQIVFPLNEYSGEEIVVAFSFNAEANGLKKEWNVDSLQIQGMGGEVTEIDYLLDNPNEAFKLAFYNMAESSIRDFKVGCYKEIEELLEIDELSFAEERVSLVDCDPNIYPKWNKKAAGFVISGFGGGGGKPPKKGVVRLLLPEIDLSGKVDARVRMRHKVFFFRDPNISPLVTKVQIKAPEESEWNEIEFPEGTFRDKMPREPELSGWAKIPDRYLGKKVQIAFKYEAQDGNGGTVEWTLNSVEVGAK